MGQPWMDQTVVAVMEYEQDGEILLYEKITQRVFGRLARVLNVVRQQPADVVSIVATR